MPRPHPDPDPDGFWPSCDDQPPGVSIRPLRQADLAALLAHLDHDPGDTLNSKVPAPVLAMRDLLELLQLIGPGGSPRLAGDRCRTADCYGCAGEVPPHSIL